MSDVDPSIVTQASGTGVLDRMLVAVPGGASNAERRMARAERPVPVDHPGRLSDTLSALARRHRVPGAQLALHHDGETVAVEFGELEQGTGRPVTRDTAFPIGSVSKAFTATVAMILVADGDLELDAPLCEHLPELDDLGAELALRHLLSHTSGLASGPASEDVSSISLRRYVLDHCRRRNLVLPPGAGFSYSNVGYIVAGAVIEAITGMSWCEGVESILLRPLGVDLAVIGRAGPRPAGRSIASGHSVNPAVGRIRPVQQSLAPAEAPAGALAASAVDLVALGRSHVGPGMPGLLPTTCAEQMRLPVPDADPFGLADGWGLGLALFRASGIDWVGHDGNADGTSCHLRVDPVGGWVVALTSNANTGVALWQDLNAVLAHPNVPVGGLPACTCQGEPAAPPPGCAGTYVNGDEEYVVATGEDGQLYLAVDDADFERVTCYEGLTFALRDPASGQQVLGGRFVRDAATDEVDGVQVGGRFARRRPLHAGEVA